jgi:hypothetical protein
LYSVVCLYFIDAGMVKEKRKKKMVLIWDKLGLSWAILFSLETVYIHVVLLFFYIENHGPMQNILENAVCFCLVHMIVIMATYKIIKNRLIHVYITSIFAKCMLMLLFIQLIALHSLFYCGVIKINKHFIQL